MLNVLVTAFIGRLTIVAAKVPPITINKEFKFQNQYSSPPPVTIPRITIAAPITRPTMVAKSVFVFIFSISLYKIKLIIPNLQSNLFFFLWIKTGFLYTIDLAHRQLNCQNLPY